MARPVTLFTWQWADLTLDVLAEKAAQNPAQQNAELPCRASHTVGESLKNVIKRGPAGQYEPLMGRVGVEPT